MGTGERAIITMVIMVKTQLKNAIDARTSLTRGALKRCALFGGIAVLAAACGGGGSGADQVTLGTGQGQGADPVTVDFPIFYTKRAVPPVPLPNGTQPSNVLRTREFDTGVDLYMRASASPSAVETNLTASMTQGLGDVRDVDVSFDGKKVIFAMRFPKRANTQEKNQPQSWDIYEYDIPSATMRGLLVDPPALMGAQKRNDRFPHYLPDGKIVFSSSRQRTAQAIQLDEGKPQYQAQDENNAEPAMNLHVMDKDGGNIRQISFNQSHDLDSGVLANGQIVFSRWDGAGQTDHVALYKMNPDGSQLELFYGKQDATHAVGFTRPATPGGAATATTVVQFLSPRQLQDGRVLTLVRPFTGTEDAGDLHSIDVSTYVENTQPTLVNAGMPGPAYIRVPAAVVYTNPSPTMTNPQNPGYSPGGRYRSAFPMPDGSNRLLVSWSQCRLLKVTDATTTPPTTTPVPCTDQNLGVTPAMEAAPPLYGIYIYNLSQGTQLPVVVPDPEFIYSDVVAAAPRTLPPVILDRVPGIDYAQILETQASGIIDIKSVYDLDGVDSAPGGIGAVRNPAITTGPQRPAQFLRVEKAVSLPDDDVRDIRNTSFGPTGRFMREILGYAPIEPDGSVRVRVPANVALQLTVVDRNARRISPLHRNWMQVQVGEVVTCNGCHTPNSPPPPASRSHGRTGLFALVNPGAPANGLFPSTDSALQGDPGETMAQVRARKMCGLTPGASACPLSVDVIYNDLWTMPAAAGRPKDASFDYCYSSGVTDVGTDPADPSFKHTCLSTLATISPVRAGCERAWASTCRIVVNYITHIQPLWEVDRIAGTANNKCIDCHSTANAASQVRVPAGQLDLTNVASTDEPDHFTSYEKLLVAHNAQELNATMTALQDVCLQTDPTTGVCIQFQVVSGSMAAANARGSRFFTAVNAASHAGFLTPAEQRLISEWLDIGAQYYNDPFLAPEN
jgi:hypothetical protein